jgi:hypothetical protein
LTFISVEFTVLGSCQSQADELISAHGDRMSGKIVSLDARNIIFRHSESREVTIPIGKIRSLTSDGALVVSLRNGDRIVGSVSINNDHMLHVRSAIMGELVLPMDAVVKGSPSSKSETAEVPTGKKNGENSLSPAEEAQVAGRGGEQSAVVAQAPSSSPDAPDTASPGREQQSPTDQQEDTKTQLRFLRTEAVLLEQRDVEADLNLSYVRNDQDPASDRIFSVAAALRVGLLTGLEGFLSGSFISGVRDVQLLRTISTEKNGVGDLRFGLKYRLIEENANWPDVYINTSVSAPTGDHPYIDVPNLGAQTPIDIRDPFGTSLGSGHWILSGGISFLRSYDPIVLFAGFQYSHALSAEYFGRDIQPGERYDVNLGLGFVISEFSTLGIQVQGSYEDNWKFNEVVAPGTNAWPLSTVISYTHRLTSKDFLEPSIAFGLTDDTTDAVFSFGYTRRF